MGGLECRGCGSGSGVGKCIDECDNCCWCKRDLRPPKPTRFTPAEALAILDGVRWRDCFDDWEVESGRSWGVANGLDYVAADKAMLGMVAEIEAAYPELVETHRLRALRSAKTEDDG